MRVQDKRIPGRGITGTRLSLVRQAVSCVPVMRLAPARPSNSLHLHSCARRFRRDGPEQSLRRRRSPCSLSRWPEASPYPVLGVRGARGRVGHFGQRCRDHGEGNERAAVLGAQVTPCPNGLVHSPRLALERPIVRFCAMTIGGADTRGWPN